METKKVIEQDGFPALTVVQSKDSVRLAGIIGSGVFISKSKATEVAKAIDPKYQELEDERDRYLKVLVRLQNWLHNGNDEFDSEQAMDLIDNVIQQSENKSK